MVLTVEKLILLVIEIQATGEEVLQMVHSNSKRSFHSQSLTEQLFSWSFQPGQKDHQDPEAVPGAHQFSQWCCTDVVSYQKLFWYYCTSLHLTGQEGCWNTNTWKINRTAKVLTSELGCHNVKLCETSEWDVVEQRWWTLTEGYICWKDTLTETVSDRLAMEN